MINQEILGGLISALSRGESLQKAMFSLFNAGYKKDEIEEAALFLKSNAPVGAIKGKTPTAQQIQSGLKKTSGKIEQKSSDTKKPEEKKQKTPEKKEEKTKQVASKYGEKNPEEFKKIIDDAIKSLTDLKSPVEVVKSDSQFKPPIIIQRVSDYSRPTRKVSRFAIVILIFLLVVLLGSLVALFIFKDKLIEIFNNLNL